MLTQSQLPPPPGTSAATPSPPAPQKLPTLSPRHQHLINAYFSHDCNLAAFSQAESLSGTDVTDWFTNPDIQAHLAALHAAADFSASMRTTALRLESLEDLRTLSKSAADPVEKRRALSAILRGSRPVIVSARQTIHTAGAAPARDAADSRPLRLPPDKLLRIPKITTHDGDPVSPLYLHSRPRFDPPKDPRDLLDIVCLALYAPSDPDCIGALHNLLAEGATLNDHPAPSDLQDFISQAQSILDYDEDLVQQTIHTKSDPDGATAHYRLVLVHGRTSASQREIVDLRLACEGGLWRIASLTRLEDSS